jgi:urease accessory protein UreF
MNIPGIPMTSLANAATKAISGFATRASNAAKGFESDIDSGNIAGAQSFLSTLQQQLSASNTGTTGSAISKQIDQVSSDLSSGNLNSAQTDFTNLSQMMSKMKLQSGSSSSSTANQSQTSNSSLAALQSYDPFQQAAFSSAVNLSMPGASPSLSVNL